MLQDMPKVGNVEGGSQVNMELGYVTPSSKYPTGKVQTGFVVKYLIGCFLYNNSSVMTFVYDADTSTISYKRYYNGGIETINLPVPSGNATGLKSIDSDGGFSLDTVNLSSMSYFTYIAVG